MKIEDYKDTPRARRFARARESEEGKGLRLVSYNVNEANFKFNYTKNAERREVYFTLKRWEMEDLFDSMKQYFSSDMLKDYYRRENKEMIKELNYLLEIALEAQEEDKHGPKAKAVS